MTFDDMRAEAGDDRDRLRASFTRSIRRLLHQMVRDGELIATGSGGRADPFRYIVNPKVIVTSAILRKR